MALLLWVEKKIWIKKYIEEVGRRKINILILILIRGRVPGLKYNKSSV
jgi:hypothetical protein